MKRPPASNVFAGSGLFLTSLLTLQPVMAMPQFANDVTDICARAKRPAPQLNSVTCTSCHGVEDPASQGGGQTLQASGLTYRKYRDAPTEGGLEAVLNTFCKGAYYNLNYSEADQLHNGALPPRWNRDPAIFNYKGSLQVHWLAELGGDNQRLELSGTEATLKTRRLPETFNLLASPENCWGEKMNFGLIQLSRRANLTIRAEADSRLQSRLIPGFAFYQGWDKGQNSQSHDTIVFGDNNPLSTEGLTFLGQALAGQVGEVAEKTFTGLNPGQYELFMTVGTNRSTLGEYVLTLTTSPPTPGINVTRTGNGRVTSDLVGIDCGPTCSATFQPGSTVTLTAKADDGYRFSRWEGCPDDTGNATCRIPLAYSMALTARFEPILHQLTVKTGATGKVYSLDSRISCGTQTLGLCQATYPAGSLVTLLAQGSFKGWSGACSGQDKRCQLTLDADSCVAASFVNAQSATCTPPPVPVLPTACGAAADSPAAAIPPVASLCTQGVASKPVRLGDGRYSWLCRATEPAIAASRCYTLGKDGKKNQAALTLTSATAVVKSGESLQLRVQGGSGNGAVRIRQKASSGTQCRITRKGTAITLTASGKAGTCTIVATKAASKTYNAVESVPFTVTVVP